MIERMNRTPDAEQLFQRVRVLFGVVPADRVQDQLGDSPYSSSGAVRSFDIELPGIALEPSDPAQSAAAWLNTPSPVFGGLCPKNFLDGSDDQRAFLDSVLRSLEDGAFS